MKIDRESIRKTATGCLFEASVGSVPSVLLGVGIGAWLLGVRWLATGCLWLLGLLVVGAIVWAVWRGVTAPREAARDWGSYSKREKVTVAVVVGVSSFFVLSLAATLVALYLV